VVHGFRFEPAGLESSSGFEVAAVVEKGEAAVRARLDVRSLERDVVGSAPPAGEPGGKALGRVAQVVVAIGEDG
jgi:hypothetical protein